MRDNEMPRPKSDKKQCHFLFSPADSQLLNHIAATLKVTRTEALRQMIRAKASESSHRPIDRIRR
jgi:hypothetical protein